MSVQQLTYRLLFRDFLYSHLDSNQYQSDSFIVTSFAIFNFISSLHSNVFHLCLFELLISLLFICFFEVIHFFYDKPMKQLEALDKSTQFGLITLFLVPS